MKNSVKRMLALALACVLCVAMLTACGGSVNVSKDGEPMLVADETAEETVIEVNDETITISDMQFYIYNSAMVQLYTMDPNFDGNAANVDWTQVMEDGRTLEETVLDEAVEMAVSDLVIVNKGKEHGITFKDDDRQQAESMIEETVAAYGEELFNLNLVAVGTPTKEAFMKMYERTYLYEGTIADIEGDFDKYCDDKEVLKDYGVDDKVTATHVLIMNEGGKYEDPLATANEVLEKAKAGEDFAALIAEYNEDPGASAQGYTFGPGEMVEGFEKAAFALGYDEISDLVETEYGYHIIKRIVGLAELENYWVSNSDVKVKKSVLKKLSVTDIVEAIAKAQTELDAAIAAQSQTTETADAEGTEATTGAAE